MVETRYRLVNEELFKELKRQYLLGKLEEFAKWIQKTAISIGGNAVKFGGDNYELEINGQKIHIGSKRKWILRKLVVTLWQEYLENNRVHHSIDVDDYITIYVMLDDEKVDWITIYEELACCILMKLPPGTDLNNFYSLLTKYFEIFE